MGDDGLVRYNLDSTAHNHEQNGTFLLLHLVVAAHDAPVSAPLGVVRSADGGSRSRNRSGLWRRNRAPAETCASRHLSGIRSALIAKAEGESPVRRTDGAVRRRCDAALCRPIVFLRRRHLDPASLEEQGTAGSRPLGSAQGAAPGRLFLRI